MAACDARNAGVVPDFHRRHPQPSRQRFVVVTAQCWMRLLRRTEIRFDSEMKLNATALEPAPAALRQFRWLGEFDHAQQIAIERARPILLARRHGKLYVINSRK